MNKALIPAFVVLALLMAAIAAAGEPCRPGFACDDRAVPGAAPARPQTVSPTPPAVGAPVPAPAPAAPSPLGEGGPSLLGALARLIGAVLVLAALMAGCVFGYRKLVNRAGNRTGVLAWATGWAEDTGADAVRVSSRRYLGGRESVAVIHAGGERFLVGITAAQVSLLARLETPEGEGVADFTDALVRAAAPQPEPGSPAEDLRDAVERSRERLGRLAHLTVVQREPRG
jgi:flagellar biogenesis protein FliO